MSKALVILSGGQDSTTCLYWALNHFDEVEAVTFNYGQRHAIEIDAAKNVVAMASDSYSKKIVHEVVEVGAILRGTSPLVSSAELDQYADFNSLPGGLEKTYVPARNLLFLTLACNIAYVKGITELVTGVCQEDFGGYPDCRDRFVKAAALALQEATDRPFQIHTPLMFKSKAEAVLMADRIDGCMAALAFTHTGYDGVYPPTGKDHATLLRAKGFFEAGKADPLVVRAWVDGLMDLPETSNYDLIRQTHAKKETDEPVPAEKEVDHVA